MVGSQPRSPLDDVLSRIIYFSRLALRYDADEGQVITDIVDHAIVRNRASGVTGLLLVHDGWCIQALEGNGLALRQTYERIAADRRHIEIACIVEGPVKARVFGEWHMCARQLSAIDAGILKVMSGKGAFNPARLDGEEALRLLRTVGAIKSRPRITALVD